MICSTCGRENPPHLTFCQECGQRLGPRIAPPTPPIGLPGGEIQSRVPTQSGQGLPMTSVPPPTTGERRCRVCETVNAAGLRYCTSCGSALEQASPVASKPASPIAPSPSPITFTAALVPLPSPIASTAPPIAPVKVMDLCATKLDPPRTCPRCRGHVDPGAQFCKFCGASLTDAAPPVHSGGPLPGQERRPTTAPLPQSAGAPVASPGPPLVVPAPVALAARPPAPASTRAAVHGRLVVIAKSGADGPSYPIGETLDIGRVEGHIVVGEDPYLSPRHVRITYEDGRLVLQDLGSTNGVYLRLSPSRDMYGRRDGAETAVPLQDQDLILVGQQVLRFEVLKDAGSGTAPAVEHGTLLFGSPAGPRYARLGQRTVEGITRDVYYVRKVETVLGRESGEVVFTEDPFLSRRHAAVRILARDGQPVAAGARLPPDTRFALVDLGSSNGTFLRIRTEIELVRGDHFRVGQQLFRVDLDKPLEG